MTRRRFRWSALADIAKVVGIGLLYTWPLIPSVYLSVTWADEGEPLHWLYGDDTTGERAFAGIFFGVLVGFAWAVALAYRKEIVAWFTEDAPNSEPSRTVDWEVLGLVALAVGWWAGWSIVVALGGQDWYLVPVEGAFWALAIGATAVGGAVLVAFACVVVAAAVRDLFNAAFPKRLPSEPEPETGRKFEEVAADFERWSTTTLKPSDPLAELKREALRELDEADPIKSFSDLADPELPPPMMMEERGC